MADNPPKASNPAAGTGGLLGALGLPPRALLLVAVLALLVGWYYRTQGAAFNNSETAVVVFALALAVAAVRVAVGMVRRLRAPPARKPRPNPP